MSNSHKDHIQAEYDLLLIDENVNNFPQDVLSISSRSMEFVPELEDCEFRSFCESKADIHALYFSYNPEKLIIANKCGIDTCFLNNGINDTIDFEKTYEIPYPKQLVKK